MAINVFLLDFLTGLQGTDAELFTYMTQALNEEQKNHVQFVINTGINKQNKLGNYFFFIFLF